MTGLPHAHPALPPDSLAHDIEVVLLAIAFLLIVATVCVLLFPLAGPVQ